MIVPLLLLMEGALSLSQLAEEVNNSAFSLMAFWLVSKGEMVAGEHGLIQLLFWLSSTRRAVFIEWLTLERSDSSDCRSCVRGIQPQLSAWWSQSIHSHTHKQTNTDKHSLKDHWKRDHWRTINSNGSVSVCNKKCPKVLIARHHFFHLKHFCCFWEEISIRNSNWVIYSDIRKWV